MVDHVEQSLVPRPDPTVLTTQQLQREIGTSRELVETRVLGVERAIDRLHVTVDRLPALIVEQVSTLQALHDERFSSIETQFRERDTRTEQTSKDSKVAVDAALQAAKEAVGAQQTANASSIDKSEKATSKQIDSIVALLQTTAQATNDKIDDLKTRLTAMESSRRGGSEGLSMAGSIFLGIVTLVGVLISLASLVFVMTHNWK